LPINRTVAVFRQTASFLSRGLYSLSDFPVAYDSPRRTCGEYRGG